MLAPRLLSDDRASALLPRDSLQVCLMPLASGANARAAAVAVLVCRCKMLSSLVLADGVLSAGDMLPESLNHLQVCLLCVEAEGGTSGCQGGA